MRKRRVLGLLLACVVIGVVGALVWPREREPEYEGKKLSEWLRAYEKGYSNETEKRVFVAEQEAAADAIRHLGTNALPCLLGWIMYEPPAWRERIPMLLWKLPIAPIRRMLWNGDRLAMDANWGFKILGPRASPVVPELARLANDPRRKRSQEWAMSALTYIGKEGFPALLTVLENPSATGHSRAATYVWEMYRSGVDISAAVPALLLQDIETSKYSVAHPETDVMFAASNFGDAPQVFAPALANCLRHTNSNVRLEAAINLSLVGKGATSAVPALVSALNDTDKWVRVAVTNALRNVAPDALPAASPEPKVQSPKSDEPEK